MHTGLAFQTVDALRAASGKPALDILYYHAGVAPRTLRGDGTLRLLNTHRVVVRVGHSLGGLPVVRDVFLERVARCLHVEDMCHPAAQKALLRFPHLIVSNGRRCNRIHFFVPAWERRRHAADGHRATLQADCYQTAEDVRHEVSRLDVNAEPVRPNHVRVVHYVFEDACLQVPAGGVESCRIGAQLVQQVFHYIHGGQGLNEEDASYHCVVRIVETLPAEVEEISIECGLFYDLNLGQVEVETLSALHLRLAAVGEGERHTEQRG